MNDLKYCSLFKKYNDDIYDISKICKACVFLPNEGLVLSTNGEVFHVFNTGFKKLGIFSKKNVIDFAHATSIVNSKLAHLILVLTEYEIYGWGQNEYRQVSINTANDVPEPQKLAIPSSGCFTSDKFTSISCVYGHCMALTSDNCLILWGSNSHGQIGNGTTSSIEAPYRIKFKKPLCKTEFKDKRIIDNPSKIISIACSSRNSYVLLENGDVYGWGENRTGQMGTVHVDNYVYPRLIYSRIKQFVAIRSYALALRKDGTLFGNGDNSFGQIEDYDGKQFYDKPFRFALKFEKFATWNNLSMGLTEDGRCFIWGEYGEVEFASVTRRIQIDKRKINQGTQVNLIEEQSENVKSNSVDKSNSVKSKQEEIEERTNEDLLVDKNCFNENKLEENNQHESIAAASNMSTNQGEINTDKEDEENTDKNLEKEKIREIINNGKIEKHKANLILKRPKEIKCKSFSKIIAKRFDSTYFTVKKSDNLSNDYRDDDENDLIDFSNLIIVITEYEEIVEQEVKPVAKMDDKKENDKKEKDEQSEQYKKIEERLERIEKKKSKTIKNYYGNKNKSVLFNKSTLSEVGDFKINDIHQTGTVGAGTTN